MANLTGDTLYNIIINNKNKINVNLNNETFTTIYNRVLPTINIPPDENKTDETNKNTASNPVGVEDKAKQEQKKRSVSLIENQLLIINYKKTVIPISVEKDEKGNVVKFENKLKSVSSVAKLNKKIGGIAPDVETIVSRTGDVGKAVELKYADFLYCKRLNAYPNNRLVILRRFATPVEDNIIDCAISQTNLNQDPLAVLVTWFDEFPMTLDFREKWDINSAGMMEAIQDVSDTLSSPNKPNSGDNSTATETSNPYLSSLWYTMILKLNEDEKDMSAYKNILPGANPNLIKQSAYRKAASLESNITFELKFEYVLRYIDGIDPHMAMHNIIANIIRMGTSTSISTYPPLSQDSEFKKIFEEVAHGKVLTALSSIFDVIKEYFKDKDNTLKTLSFLTDKVTSMFSSGQSLAKEFESYTSKIMSIFRFKLIAALQADTAMASGQWHVTVGNPFNPIVSVGDLILADAVNIKFNNELSYNDFPTEIYATIKLKSVRSRGAQELEQIFNTGFGRIYVYPTNLSNPDYFSGEIYNSNKCPNTDKTEK